MTCCLGILSAQHWDRVTTDWALGKSENPGKGGKYSISNVVGIIPPPTQLEKVHITDQPKNGRQLKSAPLPFSVYGPETVPLEYKNFALIESSKIYFNFSIS